MTRISALCLAHMVACTMTQQHSKIQMNWNKDVNHFIPPSNQKNNKKTKPKRK